MFISIPGPDILTGADIATMADGAVVFALANPVPEVLPVEARTHAAILATGRSDHPNQINNVLPFPASSGVCGTRHQRDHRRDPGRRSARDRRVCHPEELTPTSSFPASSTSRRHRPWQPP
ncbi:Rossmann-fold NAD(P)-binding domain-containing protein [Modestobacter lapidis]